MARKRKPIVGEDLKSNKRIPFGPEIIELMPCSWVNGGWTHRRHIISQHFLRDAWNVMADRLTLDWLKQVADMVVQVKARLPKDSEAMSDTLRKQYFASEILRWMNDNPRNLFVDDGGENSGIGSFSHTMDSLLSGVLELDWDTTSFLVARNAVVTKLENSSGSWGHLAKEHYEWIKGVGLPLLEDAPDYDSLVAVLEDLQFSTDLDLDKTQDQRLKNVETLYLRAEFLRFKEGAKTHPRTFAALINRFVNGGGG
jgi:hypothetical protein